MDSLIHLQTHAIRVPLQSAVVLTQGQSMKVSAVIFCCGFLDSNAIVMIKASFYLLVAYSSKIVSEVSR